MKNLELWANYSREDVHGIFSPQTIFTPQSGTWGLQGIVPITDRPGDWVFFVTFGQEQGKHAFDESITTDGVLSWQSQPSQKLTDKVIKKLIDHDDRTNSIHLFLRTDKRVREYIYLGTLGYLTHDATREQPVYFQWQLLAWPAPQHVLEKVGTALAASPALSQPTAPTHPHANTIEYVPAPNSKKARNGVTTQEFRAKKSPNYAERDHKNRQLGLAGEKLVLSMEQENLIAAGRDDLARRVAHISLLEGDGAGYDILSFIPDGRHRFIEVKTTKGGASTGFYISPNEIAFSVAHSEAYALVRVYEYDQAANAGKAFVLEGDITEHLELIPTEFRASVI